MPAHRIRPSAIVKGAGPAGLAAAVSLAQAGYDVQVIERRPRRPPGQGRKNMVALRPEALRRLDELGALGFALDSNSITRMIDVKVWSETDGTEFSWPLLRYPAAESGSEASREDGSDVSEYQVPDKINEQFPANFVDLGDLEDALAHAASSIGVEIIHDATVFLSKDYASSRSYSVELHLSAGASRNLGTPDLIVCASGKNDTGLRQQLAFEPERCTILSEARLKEPNPAKRNFALTFRTQDESEPLESQQYAVFGIRNPNLTMGTIAHATRKYENKSKAQPLVEIQMNHATAAHFILQHPRSLPPLSTNPSVLESFILTRINNNLSTFYASLQELKDSGDLLWGDPMTPVTVETSTAPQYVFGDNVVLIGDCAMSCSPASGLGADIGMTVDSRSVGILGEGLIRAGGDEEGRYEALMEFNMRKAESAVIWSQGSRGFYLTKKEADALLSDG